MADPEVSILCVTYNQVDFLEQTLESFLAQETSFDFEILIHDDCSTDGTTELIRSYEERYPGKIRGFYEEVNRYYEENGGRYFTRILAPAARGKYVAHCEGDDYWIDPNKLQRQYDYLEANPDCVLCCTSARVIDGLTGETIGRLGPVGEDRDLTFEDICRNWPKRTKEGLWRLPVASAFLLRETSVGFGVEWPFNMPIGDNAFYMYAAHKGRVHYIDEDTCVYRYQTKGAWTSYVRKFLSGKQYNERIVAWEMRRMEMTRNIDEATGGQYHDLLEEDLAAHTYYLLYTEGPIEFLKNHNEELGHYLTPDKWVRAEAVRAYIGARRVVAHLGFEIEDSPFTGMRIQRTRNLVEED